HPTPLRRRSPTLWISWNKNKLITLSLPRRVTGRAAVAFVPPGAQGIAMSTWLSGVGATPVPLVGDARRGLANGGSARFGQGRANCRGRPTGPRHGIAPGALWLARATD